MRLLCAYCDQELYVDLADDETAKKEIKHAQSLPCNPHKEDTKHKFNRLG